MSIVVQNPNVPNVIPVSKDIYNNGHFSSSIESDKITVPINFFKTSPDFKSLKCKISFADFDTPVVFKVLDLKTNFDSNEIIFILNFENHLKIIVILKGNWEESKQNSELEFKVTNLELKLYESFETPISVFLKTTLWVLLGLSSKFKIQFPFLDNYFLCANFELPLDEISKILQERQIAFRLLVIETATNIKFNFPNKDLKGEDIENIAYCYKSIIERNFEWFDITRTIKIPANKKNLSFIPPTKEPTTLEFTPTLVTQSIFGIEFPFGYLTGKIENAVFENYEEVKKRFLTLNNELIDVRIKSLNGTIKIKAIDVPSLPPNPWNNKLKKLIDLDSKFDDLVLEKYFTLATSTMEGLSEDQKKEITMRPELEEEAFDF